MEELVKFLNGRTLAEAMLAVGSLVPLAEGKTRAQDYWENLTRLDPFVYVGNPIWGRDRRSRYIRELGGDRDWIGELGCRGAIFRAKDLEAEKQVGTKEIGEYYLKRCEAGEKAIARYNGCVGEIGQIADILFGAKNYEDEDGERLRVPDIEKVRLKGHSDVADVEHPAKGHPFVQIHNCLIRYLGREGEGEEWWDNKKCQGLRRTLEYMKILGQMLIDMPPAAQFKILEKRISKMIRNQCLSLENAYNIGMRRDAEFQLIVDRRIGQKDFVDSFLSVAENYNEMWRFRRMGIKTDKGRVVFTLKFRNFIEAFSPGFGLEGFAQFFKDHLDYDTEQNGPNHSQGDYDDFVNMIRNAGDIFDVYGFKVDRKCSGCPTFDVEKFYPMSRFRCPPSMPWDGKGKVTGGTTLRRLEKRIADAVNGGGRHFVMACAYRTPEIFSAKENFSTGNVWWDDRTDSWEWRGGEMYKRKPGFRVS